MTTSGSRKKRERGPDGRFLSGDCERDCQKHCAYPGQFSECAQGVVVIDREGAETEVTTEGRRSREPAGIANECPPICARQAAAQLLGPLRPNVCICAHGVKRRLDDVFPPPKEG